MAELIVRLGGGPPRRVSIDDPTGETWTATVLDAGTPADDLDAEEVVVHVVQGDALGGAEARATVVAGATGVALIGLEPFAVTDEGNSL